VLHRFTASTNDRVLLKCEVNSAPWLRFFGRQWLNVRRKTETECFDEKVHLAMEMLLFTEPGYLRSWWCRVLDSNLREAMSCSSLPSSNLWGPAEINKDQWCITPSGYKPFANSPLHPSAVLGLRLLANELLEQGVDVNGVSAFRDTRSLDSQSVLGTPLHSAVFFNRPGVVTILAAHEADFNLQDSEGQTPLHGAAGCGYTEMANRVLDHGASAEVSDRSHCTALWLAAKSGHEDVVEVILRHGANMKLWDIATP